MERFFQASRRQVPPFSANFHPSVQNRSTLQLIYQLARERDQALANQRRAEQERRMQAAKARGKGKVREEIERYILRQYAMEKHPSGVDYTITIPNETDEQLKQIIYRDILQEAASTADARYCFIEADVRARDDSGRHW
jgi:hypothetical protein